MNKYRFIVADDDSVIALDIVQMLQENGHIVLGIAKDGLDAIKLTEETKPDIIIMDIQMPLVDGFSAAQNILQTNPDLCVICCTAFADDEFIKRAEGIGIAGYIVKPINERSLISAIEFAYSMTKRLAKKRQRVLDAENKLKQRTMIDQACAEISAQQHIDPNQAYRFLQKTSMDRGIPMFKLAELIVENSEKNRLKAIKDKLASMNNCSASEMWNIIRERSNRNKISCIEAANQLLMEFNNNAKSS